MMEVYQLRGDLNMAMDDLLKMICRNYSPETDHNEIGEKSIALMASPASCFIEESLKLPRFPQKKMKEVRAFLERIVMNDTFSDSIHERVKRETSPERFWYEFRRYSMIGIAPFVVPRAEVRSAHTHTRCPRAKNAIFAADS